MKIKRNKMTFLPISDQPEPVVCFSDMMRPEPRRPRELPPRRYAPGPPFRGRGGSPPRGRSSRHPKSSKPYPLRPPSYQQPPHAESRFTNHLPLKMDTSESPRRDTQKPQSSSSRPLEPSASPETPLKKSVPALTPSPSKLHQDPWRLKYHLEKERLSSPSDSKPSSIYFFTGDRFSGTTESRYSPRKITSAYTSEQLFGPGSERTAHLRDVPVTFEQIWNRELIIKKWDRQKWDHEGWMVIEEMECKIQLQRHHIPGTMFITPEGGSLDINVMSSMCPDVYFRLVDAEGQEFTRSEKNKYDLMRRVDVEEGQTNLVFTGIDGCEIKVEIERGEGSQRLVGQGMPRIWDGTNRGELIVEFVKKVLIDD